MNRIIFASMEPGVGKTSFALGAAHLPGKPAGYLKPFGDRPLYRKKRLWDADCAVATIELGLGDDPSALCIGLAHAKIRFMHERGSLKGKLVEMAEAMEREGRERLFVEAGGNLSAGSSIDLDALSITEALGGKLFVVLAGENDAVADQATFLARHLSEYRGEVDFGGILVNKVRDRDDFDVACLPALKETGLRIAGVAPYRHELSAPTVAAIADQLPALVVAGKPSAKQVIGRIFLGTGSVSAARKSEAFLSRNKLVVTTAEHPDLILAALEGETAGILLAGEDLPHASILARAEEQGVPVLSVHEDLLSLAGSLQKLQARLTAGDGERFALLAALVRDHLEIGATFPTPT